MYVLVDIGGTKTRVAGAKGTDRFEEPVIFSTPQKYDDALEKIEGAARGISADIERIVVGKPGTENLPAWAGKSFSHDLAARIGAPVHVENDTALVGLGESVYGAGRGAALLAYVTVSTGVNGVRIVDRNIDRSCEGFEIGGQYLSMGEEPQTLEDLVSGKAIAARFGVHSPKDLGRDHPVWEELARTVAFGVHNTILHWSPERLVLGGSMFNEIGISVSRVEAHVREIMRKFSTIPRIVHSELGDTGGLWGALAHLKGFEH